MHSGQSLWVCQQKYTVCDAYRPCHSIVSTPNPVLAKFDRFIALTTCSGAYNDNNNKTDCSTPCTCVQGNKWFSASCGFPVYIRNCVMLYSTHFTTTVTMFCYSRYFQCEPKHGLFAPLPKVEKLATAGSEGSTSK